MRKSVKKLVCFLTCACMIMAMCIPAFAEDSYETTYTVHILSGSQGTYLGQSEYTGLKYGDTITVTISEATVSMNNSKYYPKGLKDSGMDNNHISSDFSTKPYLTTDGSGNYTITVTKDQDFVVSYGLKGSSVAYYINYQDVNGNELMPSVTYYGGVGDKPVISRQYIENYQPQAYNLTKTLSSDASQNVFTFVYTYTGQPEVTPAAATEETAAGTDTTGTTGTTGTEGTTGTTGTTGTAGTAGTAAGGTGTTAGGAQTDVNTQGSTGSGNESVEQTTTPREIIDLDEEETPLANVTEEPAGTSGQTASTNVIPIVIGCIAAVLAIIIIAILIKKRKR